MGPCFGKNQNSVYHFSRADEPSRGASDLLASPSLEHGASGAQKGAGTPQSPVAAARVGRSSSTCRSALMCSVHPVILLLNVNSRTKMVICTTWGLPGRGKGVGVV